MQRRAFLTAAGTLLAAALQIAAIPARADDGVAIIAHTALRGIDAEAVRRIYSGRMVELDGQPLRPVHLRTDQPLRQRFLQTTLQQTEADYTAYWTVRRYIGKGTPPPELSSTSEVIGYVQRTPGAIGYIDTAELRPGLNVLLRR